MKKLKITAAIAAVLVTTISASTAAFAADSTDVTPPAAISVIIEGDTTITGNTAEYTITYIGDVSLITVSEKSIGLQGFKAEKKVVINDDNSATLTLTNIVDTEGDNAIRLAGGTAITDDLVMAEAGNLENIVILNNNPNTGIVLPAISTAISAVAAFVLRKRNK